MEGDDSTTLELIRHAIEAVTCRIEAREGGLDAPVLLRSAGFHSQRCKTLMDLICSRALEAPGVQG